MTLKLNFATTGILQLFTQLFSDSVSVSDLLGIDTEAIWKIRALNLGIGFVGNFVLIANKVTPIFYFRLIQSPIPESSWFISVMSTSLVFSSFNLLVVVQICKSFNNWKIVREVLGPFLLNIQSTHTHTPSAQCSQHFTTRVIKY